MSARPRKPVAGPRSRWRIWLAAATLAVVGSSATAWQLADSRLAHLNAAKQLAQSLSNAAAQRIGGSLRSMDVLLTEASQSITDPIDIDTATFDALRTKVAAFPELNGVSVIDANGIMRRVHNVGHADSTPLVDISDRPHFRFQREHFAERRMFFTAPLTDRITGKTMIFLSRPILGPDGGFRGMAGMAVRPSFLRQAIASVVPAEGDAAGAFTPDGILFQRVPEDERFVGKSIADSALYHAYRSGATEQAISFSDGRERILGFAPVPGYPLVAAVGIARDKVLADWWRGVTVHGTVQGAFVAFVLLFAWGLARSEARRQAMTDRMLAAERGHVESLAQAVSDRTAELNASLAALSDSEERFRRIVDISPLPLVLTRRSDDLVLYINAGAAETFGVPQEDAMGKVAPNFWDSPADRARMIDILRKDGQIRNLEATLKRANGERFTALLSAATVTLQGERLVLVSVLDITERKRLEEDFARSNRDLEQFSYAVSHDLQEPLRMVSSYLALLDRRYGGTLTDDAREFIAFAVDGAQRMSRMITDLLEYSRVHRKGSHFAQVSLDCALDEALINLSTAIEAAGATVKARPLPVVMGDNSQLMRVFQNLVGNAVKYRKPDVPPIVTIDAQLANGQWRISVADNGIGIAPAMTGRLFQVFQRLHPRGTFEGSGVGLALCRRILERHNGQIWVESGGAGLGSTFIFTLPAALEDGTG